MKSKTRKFNGRRFKLFSAHIRKPEANLAARRLRQGRWPTKKGTRYRSRVVKAPKAVRANWLVYTRRR